MNKYHEVEKVGFEKEKLILRVDGKEYMFSLADISQKLADAQIAEREKYEISPSGYGIHWPLIDEDLSIDALIGVKHKRIQTKESISA
ncbi:MAG: DUF2442 domain-containing protein [Sedimentisphaerales bacterium]